MLLINVGSVLAKLWSPHLKPGNPLEGRMEDLVELYSPNFGVIRVHDLEAMWEKRRMDWIARLNGRNSPCLIEDVAEKYADEIFDSKSSRKPVPLKVIIATLQDMWEDDDEIDLSLGQEIPAGEVLLKQEP